MVKRVGFGVHLFRHELPGRGRPGLHILISRQLRP
jgi:hypothetical protein